MRKSIVITRAPRRVCVCVIISLCIHDILIIITTPSPDPVLPILICLLHAVHTKRDKKCIGVCLSVCVCVCVDTPHV